MPNPTSAKGLSEIRFSDISSADIFDLSIKFPLQSITILA